MAFYLVDGRKALEYHLDCCEVLWHFSGRTKSVGIECCKVLWHFSGGGWTKSVGIQSRLLRGLMAFSLVLDGRGVGIECYEDFIAHGLVG